MKKVFAVLGLLTILLISFGSCRNEEILENTENSKEQLTLIKSKSLWKENITFISQVKRVFDKKVDAKKFSKKHGSAYWEYALSFEKNGEPYIFVPIVKDNQVKEVMLVLKEKKKIRFYFNKDDKSKKAFFDILIKEKSAKAGSNVRKGNASNRLVCGWREIVWVWNTGIEKTTYEYFCVDVSLSYIDTDLGGGSGFDIDDGNLPGGGDVGNPIDTTKVKMPCEKIIAENAKAKELIAKAKANGRKVEIISGINTASQEKGFSFGADTNGTEQVTGIKTGVGGNAVDVEVTNPSFTIYGAAHTHTPEVYNVPSVGDVYNFFKANTANLNFKYYYTFAQDNNDYVFTIADPINFASFTSNYPEATYLDGAKWKADTSIANDFKYIIKQQEDLGKTDDEAYDIAMAFVLNKYNTGIGMSKKDTYGNYKPIFVNETVLPVVINNGIVLVKTYNTTTDCNLK